MTWLLRKVFWVSVVGMAVFYWTERAEAAGVIVNGSFETGDYSGWTLLKNAQRQTNGTWATIQNGEAISRFQMVFDYCDEMNIRQDAAILPRSFQASDGENTAVQLQNGPLLTRMMQDVALPDNATALSWDMAYRNFADEFSSNQYLAVHIRDLNDAILDTVYITGPGSPAEMPMNTLAADISSFAGKTVRLDVEIKVGVNFLPVNLDNFRVETVEVETVAPSVLPPGWAKGKKTGWQGELPPGLERQEIVPPGQENRQSRGSKR